MSKPRQAKAGASGFPCALVVTPAVSRAFFYTRSPSGRRDHTNHTQGVEKLLGNSALWNAVDAASNNPTHADSALADLKQQLHDTFDHNGANGTVDNLAALLHFTHHE